MIGGVVAAVAVSLVASSSSIPRRRRRFVFQRTSATRSGPDGASRCFGRSRLYHFMVAASSVERWQRRSHVLGWICVVFGKFVGHAASATARGAMSMRIVGLCCIHQIVRIGRVGCRESHGIRIADYSSIGGHASSSAFLRATSANGILWLCLCHRHLLLRILTSHFLTKFRQLR